MKILLLGASGQVGFELCRALAPVAEVVAPGLSFLPRLDLDDFAALEKCIGDCAPDLVINAAAYTAVDKAETDRERASIVNAEAPGVMSRAAGKSGAALVHYSTDYVFDGSGSHFRTEEETPAPINHYGATKLAGEQAVVSANSRALILRTSWVYAAHGKNFPKTILKLAASRSTLSVVADQIGAPTGAPLIADATVDAILAMKGASWKSGIFHLAAGGETSWCDFARFLCSEAEANGLLPTCPEILPIPTADYALAAQRPLNSRLDTRKFRNVFGLRLPDWKVGAAHLVAELAKARL